MGLSAGIVDLTTLRLGHPQRIQHFISAFIHLLLLQFFNVCSVNLSGECRSWQPHAHVAAAKERAAPSTQLRSSMAMVMGPTPPGTGVIWLALSLASAKLTSPTRR